MARVTIEPFLNPPALHRTSPLYGQIDEAKAAILRVNVTKLANDEALIAAGRVISQLRDQTPVGWGKFCQAELGISKQWANKLIGFFKGKETPAQHREKKAKAAVDAEDKTVAKVKKDETARITKIRELIAEWRKESGGRHPDDILADIEELVK